MFNVATDKEKLIEYERMQYIWAKWRWMRYSDRSLANMKSKNLHNTNYVAQS